jgi:hypothetical protein
MLAVRLFVLRLLALRLRRRLRLRSLRSVRRAWN